MKSLSNQIIIAMPHMQDNLFKKSVVLILEHNSKGATGLVINKEIEKGVSSKIIDNLNQDIELKIDNQIPVFFGGPLSTDRGIVLHNSKALGNESIKITSELFLSSNINSVLKAQSLKKCNYKFLLGYSGWSANQLDSEIEKGDWIMQEAYSDFIFSKRSKQMWDLAISSIGIEKSDISIQGGIS